MNLSFLKKTVPNTADDFKVITDKDGIRFLKSKDNIFSIRFSILNNFVSLPEVVNFNFIRLIYDLNPDVYEYVNVNISDNGEEAHFLVTMKHFFKDLGLPQKYSSLHVTQTPYNSKLNTTEFYGKTTTTQKPPNLPNKAELLPLQHMNIKCEFRSNHEVNFSVELIFEDNFSLLPMVEKLVGKILYKIFNNTKKFIQGLRP